MPTNPDEADNVAEAPLRAERAIRSLAYATLTHASLVLFGSRARGDASRRSDFDLAVIPREGFEESEILRFSELLEQSPEIIYPIDLVDMRTTSPELREKIEREGRRWKN